VRSQTTPTEVFKSQQPYPHYCTVHYVLVDQSETQQICAVRELTTGIKTDIIIPFPGKQLKTRQVRQEEVGQFGIITVAMETLAACVSQHDLNQSPATVMTEQHLLLHTICAATCVSGVTTTSLTVEVHVSVVYTKSLVMHANFVQQNVSMACT
jgi:hypothetical protein